MGAAGHEAGAAGHEAEEARFLTREGVAQARSGGRQIHGPDHEPAAIIAERNLVMVRGLYSGVTEKPSLSVDISRPATARPGQG